MTRSAVCCHREPETHRQEIASSPAPVHAILQWHCRTNLLLNVRELTQICRQSTVHCWMRNLRRIRQASRVGLFPLRMRESWRQYSAEPGPLAGETIPLAKLV